MTNWTNITQPNQLMDIPNANTGGNFYLAMLFMVWIILFIIFSFWGFEVAILGASFICLVADVFLVYMGLMSWAWCLFFLGMILFFFMYRIYKSK